MVDTDAAKENRAELKMLQNAVDISKQTTNIIRAAYLPQIALTAGYLVTNPTFTTDSKEVLRCMECRGDNENTCMELV